MRIGRASWPDRRRAAGGRRRSLARGWPSRLLAGAAAGLWGSASAILVLWGAWMLPVLGLVLARVAAGRGVVAVAVLGLAGGIVYAALRPVNGLRPAASAAGGLVLGLAMWGGGALLLIPRILGLPALPVRPIEQLPSLAAFIAYGLTTAFAYEFLAGRLPGLRNQRADRGGEMRKNPGATIHILDHPWSSLAMAITLTALSGLGGLLLWQGAHTTDPRALVLPPGFGAQVIAEGLTFPTSLAWGPEGILLVGESGYSYGPKEAVARVLAVYPDGRVSEVARGFDGPLNGLAYLDGKLYVSHRGKVTVLQGLAAAAAGDPAAAFAGAERTDLVIGLPSWGDHHNNELVIGPDGFLYIGQGTATNAGVVGHDNFIYAWADDAPLLHDVPSRAWVLTGHNYQDVDLRTVSPLARATTGAFAPFDSAHPPGAQIAAGALPSGTVLRINPDTGTASVYADGLRNPYGLAFGPQGQLYATNLGYDDRGVRAVLGSPDWVVEVTEGAWYGWPDYAGVVALADERFASRRGVDRHPLLANPPPVTPPLAELPSHSSPMKLAVSPGGAFGDAGALYVAVFGDAGAVVGEPPEPRPTGVLSIDPLTGETTWFLHNRALDRASRWGDGLKRTIAVTFDSDGDAMYVLDFGLLQATDIASNPIPATGVLWRIFPAGAPVLAKPGLSPALPPQLSPWSVVE